MRAQIPTGPNHEHVQRKRLPLRLCTHEAGTNQTILTHSDMLSNTSRRQGHAINHGTYGEMARVARPDAQIQIKPGVYAINGARESEQSRRMPVRKDVVDQGQCTPLDV